MSDKTEKLIQEALNLLKDKSYDSKSKYSQMQLSEIIHELDVYQAELEVQNNELLQKEAQLKESYEEYELLFHDAPTCYIIINLKGQILKYNIETYKVFGNIIERSANFASLVKSNNFTKYFTWLNSGSGKYNELVIDVKINVNYEKFKLILKPYANHNDKFLLMLVNVQEQYDLIEKNIALVEEKRLREAIIFNQNKITGIGDMLSNVAHQWRQPLNLVGIMISTVKYNITRDNFDKDEIIDQLSKATESVEYLSSIIDDFKSYYNNDSIEKVNYNINDVFQDLLKLSNSEFEKENIKLIVDSKDIFIFKSKTYFLEILVNLVKNSKDAFMNKKVDKPIIIIETIDLDDKVEINVKDNAGGIDKENLPKIFEPYFSTKFPSVGIGLGLYMVYELVSRHFDGIIEATNVEFEYEDKNYFGTNMRIIFSKK